MSTCTAPAPGCISHAVHREAENPRRLFFVERWTDHPALGEHFALPESNIFVRAFRALATEPPRIEIYDAKQVSGRDW